MAEKKGKNREEEPLPDRPLECSECKKPIVIRYTEIVGNHVTHTSMCAECPQLIKRLKGTPPKEVIGTARAENSTGLCCGNCGTTLDAMRMGNPLGCSVCYEVFGDVLLSELLSARKISPRVSATKKSVPAHIGRAPGETQEINPSLRLLALNEALNETLAHEDYEQAAWLRDQIKALTEKPPEKPDAGKKDRKRKK